MPLYYCVLLTIFKDLTTRGNLPAIVGSPHLNILQVFPYGDVYKRQYQGYPFQGTSICASGDTLLVLDNREYQIKVKEAEAALLLSLIHI